MDLPVLDVVQTRPANDGPSVARAGIPGGELGNASTDAVDGVRACARDVRGRQVAFGDQIETESPPATAPVDAVGFVIGCGSLELGFQRKFPVSLESSEAFLGIAPGGLVGRPLQSVLRQACPTTRRDEPTRRSQRATHRDGGPSSLRRGGVVSIGSRNFQSSSKRGGVEASSKLGVVHMLERYWARARVFVRHRAPPLPLAPRHESKAGSTSAALRTARSPLPRARRCHKHPLVRTRACRKGRYARDALRPTSRFRSCPSGTPAARRRSDPP